MMKNEKVSWFTGKKVFTIILLLVITFVVLYLLYFYQSILSSKVVHLDKTKDFILNETKIESIDDVYQFQDEEAYHIVFGTDKKGKAYVVFLQLSKKLTKEEMTTFPLDALYTQEQIEQQWNADCKECTLTGSSPAMMDDTPLWELTYKDRSNRYVIEYVSLEDGSIYEKMKLLRKYNGKG